MKNPWRRSSRLAWPRRRPGIDHRPTPTRPDGTPWRLVEITDSWRPTARAECGDQLKSLYSYLDALDGAYDHYEEVAGPIDYDAAFKKHIYHAPFPGMALQAHLSLLGRLGLDKAAATASFREKVEGGLHFAKRLGSIYGASNFVSLLGLLQSATGEAEIRQDVIERARKLLDAGQVGNDAGSLANAIIDDWLKLP